MKLNKLLVFLCLMMVIFTVAGVNASDVNETVITSDINEDVIAIDDAQNEDIGASDDSDDAIADSAKTMTDLKNTIDNSQDSTIILSDDYSYADTDSSLVNGIAIGKSVTIDGQGHKIDANKKMRIFQITDNANVIFKNIIFMNGWTARDGCGGAVWNSNGGNVTAINCTFTKNEASLDGGALYKANAVDCTFTENHVNRYGGAMYEGAAENSTFSLNEASAVNYGGGALYKANAANCTFYYNIANNGGAMYEGTAENCTFDYNRANNGGNGGALYNANAVNCTFTYNEAGGTGLGDALYGGTAENCSIIDNFSDDVIHGGAAINCTFSNGINIKSTTITFYIANEGIVHLGDTVLFEGLPKCSLTVNTTDKNGNSKTFTCNEKGWKVEGLEPGEYTVKFTINTYEHNNGNSTAQIFVKYTLKLDVNAENVDEGEAATVNLSLKDMNDEDLTADVKVIINNTEYTVNVVDGKGNITIENLAPGEYAILAMVIDNEIYENAFATDVLIIKESTKILCEDMTTTAVAKEDGRIGEYFNIQLVDAKGNPLANKKVQIGFNGNVYDRVTDSDGKAKLQINLKNAGTYTFAIAFLGDDEYNGSFVVSKIVVKKQTPKFTTSSKTYKATAKTKALTATFKTVKGTPISGKLVKFTVNGKTYSAKTDENGVATVNVSLNKKGTYSFTAKFAGDNTFAAINKTAKLTIN